MNAPLDRHPRADHLSSAITVLVLVAVTFSALAYGAVEPWSLLIFESMVLLAVALWVVRVTARKKIELNIPPTTLPILALLAVGIAQSVAISDGSGRLFSLSKNVGFTRSAVTVLAFLLICFLLSSSFFNTRQRLSTLANFLVTYGLGMALFALIQHFTWNGRFYWLRPTQVMSPFGPFANHNHFAGYMEMLIPIPIALILTRAVRVEMRLLYGFAAIVMGIATVASLSRGGMISLAASTLFLMVASVRATLRQERSASNRSTTRGIGRALSRSAVVVGISVVIGAGILWIGAEPVIRRVTQGQSTNPAAYTETFYSSRGWVWRDTLSMIRANPILGVGLGAYETAFANYSESDGSLRVLQAHNDYLQILADCGIVGGLIAVWFLALVFRAILRGIDSGDRLLAGLALGSGSGIFAILVHSCVDFNLQVPSNALLFLLLTAVVSVIGSGAASRVHLVSRSVELEPFARRIETAPAARSL